MFQILLIIAVICLVLAISQPVVNSENQDLILTHEIKQDDCGAGIAHLQDNLLEVEEKRLFAMCRDEVQVKYVKFVCRHTTYVCLEWSLQHDPSIHGHLENLTFLIEKWSDNDTKINGNWTFHTWEKGNNSKIDDLVRNTGYKFKVTPYLSKKYQLGGPGTSDSITTLTGQETLKEVKHVEVMFFDRNASITAQLRWDPLEDLFCEVIVFYPSQNDEPNVQSGEVIANNFFDIPNLLYSSSYEVILHSKVDEREGPITRFLFKTPKCINFHAISDCVPKIPKNLRVEGNCSPEIKWDDPILYVAYFTHYQVSVNTHNLNLHFTIPENETSIKLELEGDRSLMVDIALYRDEDIIGYNRISKNITCKYMENQISRVHKNYSKIKDNVLTRGKLIIVIATIISVVGIIIFTTILRIFFLGKLQKNMDSMQPDESFRKDCKNHNIESSVIDKNYLENDSLWGLDQKIFDEYEVSRDRVRLCQVLGEGEFGKVHKAVLMEANSYLRYVAVKTLRNKESPEEKRQLLKEMEVMKSVGKHRNIVSLLGCCTSDMMIIVEYCSLGDLRSFLRKTWRIKSFAEEVINEKSNIDLLDRKAFSNILYEQSAIDVRHLNISMMDLLSFARQIALGMAYLAENRVVHRDVAARNVLLAEDMTAKIADFGLSRDVYERNIYMKSSTDRLPLRWMALESLQYQVFSTKSDVWSYGILLWEIMTLGGCPYPSLQTSEMYKLLQQGYRMEKPKPCSPQLYEIMLNCWDAKSQNRPSFSQLVLSVEAIMQCESNRSYLDLSTCDYKSLLDGEWDRK